MEYLKAEKIDCAFVVLDPDRKKSGSLGMEYFIKNVGAHFIFPMHCWEQYDIIEKYKKDVDRSSSQADYEYYCAGTAVCSGLSIYHNTNRGIHGVNPFMLSTEVLLNEN